MPPKKRLSVKDKVETPKMALSSNNSITVASATVGASKERGASEHNSPVPSPAPIRADDTEMEDDTNGVAGPTPAAHSPTPANETAMVIKKAVSSKPQQGTMNGATTNGIGAAMAVRSRNPYDGVNLDDITLRQLQEDIDAYQHDLAWCNAQLDQPDLTPQEQRTFNLRCLDLAHQIRSCEHRIERLRIEMRGRPMLRGAAALAPREPAPTPNVPSNSNQIAGKKIASAPAPPTTLPVRDSGSAGPIPSTSKRPSSPEQDTTTPLAKRQKQQGSPASENSPDETSHLSLQGGGAGGGWQEGESDNVTALQRLGFWQCRLCETRKYLEAGAGRTPAAPCKWPLKDVSKMITHFTDMHLEHSAAERCVELGTALNRNRGPFEYWLRRTRQQNIGDGSCMDEAIGMLVEGQMPPLLRKLSRAAARMAEY